MGARGTFLDGAENSAGGMEPGGLGCADGTGSCSQSEVSEVCEGRVSTRDQKARERKTSYAVERGLAQQGAGRIKTDSLQNQKLQQPVTVQKLPHVSAVRESDVVPSQIRRQEGA